MFKTLPNEMPAVEETTMMFNLLVYRLKVTNNIELWNWMRGTFLPFVYAGVWYNGMKENQTVYIGNKRSLLVGMPRARQLRVGQSKLRYYH